MSSSRFSLSKGSMSLATYTLSPGWTSEEVLILRQAVVKFGIGNWSKIVDSGCLPGKKHKQVCTQTQTLLGQQSVAEFAGLHIDPVVIGEKNSKIIGPDVKRKGGVIINTGDKLKPEEIRRKIEENRAYELPESVWSQIVLPKADYEFPKSFSEFDQKKAELIFLKEELKKVRTKLNNKKKKFQENDENDEEEDEKRKKLKTT